MQLSAAVKVSIRSIPPGCNFAPDVLHILTSQQHVGMQADYILLRSGSQLLSTQLPTGPGSNATSSSPANCCSRVHHQPPPSHHQPHPHHRPAHPHPHLRPQHPAAPAQVVAAATHQPPRPMAAALAPVGVMLACSCARPGPTMLPPRPTVSPPVQVATAARAT